MTLLPAEDGLRFERVRAVVATREGDDYDGVKVTIDASVDGQTVAIRIDVGFGDAVEPPVSRLELTPFLASDPPAVVKAYGPEPVIAEKAETILSKFPAIRHRLKDILDVAVLARELHFEGQALRASTAATFRRRGTEPDPAILDDLVAELTGRRWETEWAAMVKEKAVLRPPTLAEATSMFDRFVRPIIAALQGGPTPGLWPPAGPWSA